MLTPQQVIEDLLPKMQAYAPGSQWSVRVFRGSAWLNIYDRSQIVVASPASEGVALSVREVNERRDQPVVFPVRGADDIDRAFPEIASRAAWWASRLTLFRLEPGKQYVPLQEFKDRDGRRFAPGDVLTFERRDFAIYDGFYVLNFREGVMTVDEAGPLHDEFDAYVAARVNS